MHVSNTTITGDEAVPYLCQNRLFLLQAVGGCFDKLLQLIKDNAVIIAAVAVGVAALEVQKAVSNSPGSLHVIGHQSRRVLLTLPTYSSCFYRATLREKSHKFSFFFISNIVLINLSYNTNNMLQYLSVEIY